MKNGIDAHCHIEHMEHPEKIAEEVRKNMIAAVCSVPNPNDFEKIMQLREKFQDCMFVCLGFHPEYIEKYSAKQIDECIDFIKENKKKLVAIGEVGLDYNWIKEKEKQDKTKEVFIQFIDLSKETKLPLVIHTRNNNEKQQDAVSDALKILTDQNAKSVMLHCFSGNENNLKYALEQDYFVSFATLICKSEKHQRLAGKTPIESMLIETDAPWLDPDSRELVNRPWKIERSAEVIANIKETTKQEILEKTTQNAKRFFELKI